MALGPVGSSAIFKSCYLTSFFLGVLNAQSTTLLQQLCVYFFSCIWNCTKFDKTNIGKGVFVYSIDKDYKSETFSSDQTPNPETTNSELFSRMSLFCFFKLDFCIWLSILILKQINPLFIRLYKINSKFWKTKFKIRRFRIGCLTWTSWKPRN